MIIDGLPSGGAEKVALTLAEGFIHQGHQVSLFSLRKICAYSLPEKLDYQVIEDLSTRPWRKLTELRRRAKQLETSIVHAEQECGKYDLIISHLHKTDRIVRLTQYARAQQVWFCLHGVFSASYLGHRSGFSRWLKIVKIRRVYQHQNIIAVSPYVLTDLKQQFSLQPKRSAIIFNPFNIQEILAQAQQPCPMAGKDYLIHVGRFHQTKRHDRLLRAYAMSGITAPLVLLGEGNSDRVNALKQLAIELLIDERVIFQGFTPNPYTWIKNARLLVVSSDSEGFGNVLVEALICGTSVVSTRCPGGPELIMQGALSRGLAELNEHDLAQKIREIYQQPQDMSQFNAQDYELENICGQYLSLI